MLKKTHTDVIPDAYCKLIIPGEEYHHFIEVDRATETERVLKNKIFAYREYMSLEGKISSYKQQYGTTKGRILFIASGATRMQNLKAITEQYGGRNRFWFTTLQQIQTADPFYDPIWHKAGSPDTFRLVR
jgi:hypothetical protein